MLYTRTIHVPKGSLWKNAGRIGREFYKRNPFVFMTSLLLLISSGLFEGAGFLTLVPLVDVLAATEVDDWSPVSLFFFEQLQAMGLEGSTIQITAIFLTAILLKAVFLFAATYYFETSIIRYVSELRLSLIQGLMDVRWGFFTDASSGRLTNTICQESERAALAAKQLVTLASFIIQTLVYMASILLISVEFMLASLAVGGFMYLCRMSLVRFSRHEGAAQAELTREYNGRIVDWLQGMKPLKAMGRSKPLTNYLGRVTEQLRISHTRLNFVSQFLAASQEPFVALGLVATMAFSVNVLGLQLASLLVGVALFSRIMGRVGALQKMLASLATFEATYYGIKGSLEEITRSREEETAAPVDPGNGTIQFTSIKLDSVSVSYHSKKVISRISMELARGTLTALSGASGAGKSTILDLLARLREPDSGQLLAGDQPLADLPLHPWRTQLGYVPQEMTMLTDTVRNNLLLGFTDICEADIWRALELAEIADFVRQMPDGLDTWVGERGQRFSGGQRQRIAIARALVHRPQLLLLDESTSALDRETEMDICRMLRNLTPEITVVATTHRPELEKWADHVIELDEGRIVTEHWPRPE